MASESRIIMYSNSPTSTKSTIERLPVEILELICGHLTPPQESRKYFPLRNSRDPPIRRDDFRPDCLAVRSTCRTFATLETPPAALFYEVNIFATCHSLQKLEQVSEHEHFRKRVHRLVFCRPMLFARYAQPGEHDRQAREDRFQMASYMPPYTIEELKVGLEVYLTGLEEQRRLLRGGRYKKTCARSMARFPHLESIFISDGIPVEIGFPGRPRMGGQTLFQSQHPGTLVAGFWDPEQRVSANRHVNVVLHAMAIANVRPKELVFHNCWGPSQYFTMEGPLLESPWQPVLSSLVRLDLSLRDGKRSDWGLEYSTVVCPLVGEMPALEELYLRFDDVRNDHPAVASLWDMRRPKLRVLTVEGLGLTNPQFSDFLKRHRRLRQLTLCNVRLSDERWPDLFWAMRLHPALDDIEIGGIGNGKLPHPISTRRQLTFGTQLTWQLYRFLHRKGHWTKKLAEWWY